MKKLILLMMICLSSVTFAQKKKRPGKAAPAVTTVLGKTDNVSAELSKNKFYLFVNNKPKKDTLLVKNFEGKKSPSDVKIMPFKAKGTSLYDISWTEVTVNETKLKTETATITVNQIWDAASKAMILENAQTTTNIREVVFLNNTQASETKEKVRKEGFDFTLLPEGDILLKNKTQENKMSYDAVSKKFMNIPTKKK